jgi:phosphoribosylaminoimidazole-succinocarboxamide synthase
MSELTAPEGLVSLGSGKVRDLYQVDDDHLLLVASDRISAFDVVLDDPVPGKGEVLTALTVFWLDLLGGLVPNHLAGWRASELPPAARHLAGRAMLVRRLDMVPFECPATKAETGHDENVSEAQVAEALGPDLAGRLRDLTLEVYRRGAEHAARRGILLADTKLEFGLAGGRIVLADEVLTPDSSRFWPAGGWSPGHSPPSFDKQYVRDWLETHEWDHQPPAPALPPDVVAGTAARYREAYERLAGRPLDAWLAEARG